MKEWICFEGTLAVGDNAPVGLSKVKELIRCRDCTYKECEGRDGLIVCDITGESHQPEWFCADGQ